MQSSLLFDALLWMEIVITHICSIYTYKGIELNSVLLFSFFLVVYLLFKRVLEHFIHRSCSFSFVPFLSYFFFVLLCPIGKLRYVVLVNEQLAFLAVRKKMLIKMFRTQ